MDSCLVAVVEIRSLVPLSRRSSLTALTLEDSQTTLCNLVAFVLLLSIIIRLRKFSDESDDMGSVVGGEESSPTDAVSMCISFPWLVMDDFSISASRSMMRSPIPTSHSLSSYSKLASLLISLDVNVDTFDVFGSVDT